MSEPMTLKSTASPKRWALWPFPFLGKREPFTSLNVTTLSFTTVTTTLFNGFARFFFLALIFNSPLYAQENPQSANLTNSGNNADRDTRADSHVSASTNADAPADANVEKIQVTGSRIKRIDLQGPLPVIIMDRNSIEKSGYNSIGDILREMTTNSFGGMREQQLSSVSGLAHVNLRGLGAERTLVLLNGKKLAADAINRAVDLNLIPVAAIERVEVLTSGGSALYGSDALGGVINMITRKDVTGMEASFQQTMTELGGGEKTHVALTSGYVNSKWNVTSVLSYRNNQKLMGDDRTWTNPQISIKGSPGTIGKVINGQKTFQPAADCPPKRVDEKGNCTYNYSPHNVVRPQIEQLSGLVEAEFVSTPHTTTYMRFLGTRKMTHFHYPPNHGDITLPTAELRDLRDANGELILDPSEISADNEIIFRQRFIELGLRRVEITTDAYTALTGIKGSFPWTESWEWDGSISYNRVYRFDKRIDGFIRTEDLKKAILSGEYRPTAADGKRGDLSSYRYAPFQKDVSEITQGELTLTGEVMEFSHGPVGMSVGVTAGRELFTTRADEASKEGLVFNKWGVDGGGSRNTLSSYMELGIPLGPFFEWQLAARYDNYSDFGETLNPHTAFRWAPSQNWMIRGSAGTGFMAPRIQDLYSNETGGSPKLIDHVLCRDKGEGCIPTGTEILRRGNPDLTEERAFYAGVGGVYQATSQFNFSMDSWYLVLDDEIGSDFSAFTEAEAKFGSDYMRRHGVDIQRDPQTNQITLIESLWLNVFSKELMGLDLKMTWTPHIKFGWLSFEVTHSHMFFYKEEAFPGLGLENKLGQWGKPEWRRQVSVTYFPRTWKNHQIYLAMRTVGPSEKLLGGRHNTYSEYDIQYNYDTTISGKGRVTLGIRNLLGSTPPLDDTNPGNQLNTSLYDNLGRYISLGYSQRF